MWGKKKGKSKYALKIISNWITFFQEYRNKAYKPHFSFLQDHLIRNRDLFIPDTVFF